MHYQSTRSSLIALIMTSFRGVVRASPHLTILAREGFTLNTAFSELHVSAVDAAMAELLGEGAAADLARRHLQQGGSRKRAKLGLGCAASLGLTGAQAVAIAACVELLHNASLVHDDLQERDTRRRGQVAIWVEHGPEAALCAGDLMISTAFASLAGLGTNLPSALKLTNGAVATTILGQSRDLAVSPQTSFDDYKAIAQAKCGPLLVLPLRLALVAAGLEDDERARKLGAMVALAYQIADDIADRAEDAARGALNACLVLEAGGVSEAEARRRAVQVGQTALGAARALAAQLPEGCGQPYLALAEKIGAQLGACCKG